jgi:hypothetical protein
MNGLISKHQILKNFFPRSRNFNLYFKHYTFFQNKVKCFFLRPGQKVFTFSTSKIRDISEKKFHHEEKGRGKESVVLKTFSTYSTWRLNLLQSWSFLNGLKVNAVALLPQRILAASQG